MSLLSSTVASLPHLAAAAAACLLALSPPPSASDSSSTADVVVLLDSIGGGEDLLPAVAALAAFASSDAARPSLTQEAGAMVPHLCRTLESGGAAAEHACVALLPLRVRSRDASAVAVRCGVAAQMAACAGDTPATQAAATGMLRNLLPMGGCSYL